MLGEEPEPSLAAGLFCGITAAVLGAALWGGITTLSGYQVGWMAIGIGVLVGASVRYGGRGQDLRFGVVGGLLALLGCLVGNLLAAVASLAASGDVPVLDVLAEVHWSVAFDLLRTTWSPIDLLFYALALWQGYTFARRGG
jgi:hypothetical protein